MFMILLFWKYLTMAGIMKYYSTSFERSSFLLFGYISLSRYVDVSFVLSLVPSNGNHRLVGLPFFLDPPTLEAGPNRE